MTRIIAAAAITYLLILAAQYRADVAELRGQVQEMSVLLEDLRQETSRTGGAEVPVDADHDTRYLCPIHAEDYIGLTSAFGVRTSPFTGAPADHQGVDMYGTWHARIVAIADGVVIDHWPPPDGYYRGHAIYGGMLRIRHDNGSVSLYAHLSRTFVTEGNRVTAGQTIGRQGETGLAHGEHLHFELEVGGARVNPLRWILM